MPLVKSSSKAARQANIEKEIASGKKPAQAVAIGYSVQREARRKKIGALLDKHMGKGE